MAVTELTQVGRCNRVGLDIRLASALDETTADWLVSRRAEVVRRPERLGEIFPAVARTVGRNDLGDGWTVDEAARASLVAALAADQSPADLATALSGVYRYGGSHGRLPDHPDDGPVLLVSDPALAVPDDIVPPTAVRDLLLAAGRVSARH